MLRKATQFCKKLSNVYLSVERVFGVLFAQFRILYPCRLYNVRDMETISHPCEIMHNILGNERGYEGTIQFREQMDEELQNLPMEVLPIERPVGTFEQAVLWRETLDPIEDPQEHFVLRQSLIRHMWNIEGDKNE